MEKYNKLNNIKGKYKIPKPFTKLITDSTISLEGMQLLNSLVDEILPKTVLEFGTGLSTYFLANILPKDAKLISIDDSEFYLNKTKEMFERFPDNIILHHAPISKHTFKLKHFLSYSTSYLKHIEGTKLDIVLIDGPLAFKFGREFGLYTLIPYISKDTLFILDDSNREKEQEALTNWNKVFTDGLIITQFKKIKKGMSIFKINNPKKIAFFPFSLRGIFINRKDIKKMRGMD